MLAVPHQSRFARQLPPGGSQGRSRASVKHQFVPLLLKADSLNWNLSFRTENCPVPFRAAAGADRTTDRTVTHWLRALPAKFQFDILLTEIDSYKLHILSENILLTNQQNGRILEKLILQLGRQYGFQI